jgi:hypothetical protein
MQRLVKYDLSTPSPKREDLIPPPLRRGARADASGDGSPVLTRQQAACFRGAEEEAESAALLRSGVDLIRLNAFGGLWIIDVARGRGTALDARKVSRAVGLRPRIACGRKKRRARQRQPWSLLPKRLAAGCSLRSIDALGVVTGQSIDLMVIANGSELRRNALCLW